MQPNTAYPWLFYCGSLKIFTPTGSTSETLTSPLSLSVTTSLCDAVHSGSPEPYQELSKPPLLSSNEEKARINAREKLTTFSYLLFIQGHIHILSYSVDVLCCMLNVSSVLSVCNGKCKYRLKILPISLACTVHAEVPRYLPRLLLVGGSYVRRDNGTNRA